MTGPRMAYAEREVEIEVIRHGGFSTFWADAHPLRAGMVTAMFEDGRLLRQASQYPWVKCRLNDPALEEKP